MEGWGETHLLKHLHEKQSLVPQNLHEKKARVSGNSIIPALGRLRQIPGAHWPACLGESVPASPPPLPHTYMSICTGIFTCIMWWVLTSHFSLPSLERERDWVVESGWWRGGIVERDHCPAKECHQEQAQRRGAQQGQLRLCSYCGRIFQKAGMAEVAARTGPSLPRCRSPELPDTICQKFQSFEVFDLYLM